MAWWILFFLLMVLVLLGVPVLLAARSELKASRDLERDGIAVAGVLTAYVHFADGVSVRYQFTPVGGQRVLEGAGPVPRVHPPIEVGGRIVVRYNPKLPAINAPALDQNSQATPPR